MRKKMTYVIEDEGRDAGKRFEITEMSATQAEDWAIRAMLALGAANVEIPDGAFRLGMAGLAEIGIKKLFALSPSQLRPLLDELMKCVVFVPNPQKPQVTIDYPLFETQVEEVATLLKLKWEVLKLHMDFLKAVGLFASVGGTAEAATNSPKPTTRTSRKS